MNVCVENRVTFVVWSSRYSFFFFNFVSKCWMSNNKCEKSIFSMIQKINKECYENVFDEFWWPFSRVKVSTSLNKLWKSWEKKEIRHWRKEFSKKVRKNIEILKTIKFSSSYALSHKILFEKCNFYRKCVVFTIYLTQSVCSNFSNFLMFEEYMWESKNIREYSWKLHWNWEN